jgi:LysM repeat protein
MLIKVFINHRSFPDRSVVSGNFAKRKSGERMRMKGRMYLLICLMSGRFLFVSAMPVDSVKTKNIKGKTLTEYKVGEHEGWYGIARKYGIEYKELRAVNKQLGDTLHIGDVVLIPSVKSGEPKKSKEVKTQTTDAGEAVYYDIRQKETLYSVSKKYNVTTAELKKWNHLSSNNLKKGERIIVGYKKTASVKTVQKTTDKEKIATAITEKEKPKSDSAIQKTVVVRKQVTDSLPVSTKSMVGMTRKEVSEQGVATWIDDENINPNKYFALHRTATVGTIIKVTNRMNHRSVFVKVVGRLPDTGDNDNIIIKISKASAEKLGVRDQRFQCDLAYGITEKAKMN